MQIMPAVVSTVVAAVIVGIGAAFFRALMRGLKTYLDDEIKSKLIPNGGSSLADRLKVVEQDVKEIKAMTKESSGCPNPGCPERMFCVHMQQAPRKFRPRLFG